MKEKQKRMFHMPSAYSILFLILLVVALVTWLIPSVEKAKIANIVMAAPEGFVDAIDVAVFVLVLGGFLNIVTASGALEQGIAVIVNMLKGREMVLIPILMLLFSLGGTTYGMAEETIAFYALIVTTMMAAGFDAMVGTAVIMLGAGSGVIGSTVNPFAISAAVDALRGAYPDMNINQTIIIGLGAVLWIVTLALSIIFVMLYAKKVKESGRSILSVREQKESHEAFLAANEIENGNMDFCEKKEETDEAEHEKTEENRETEENRKTGLNARMKWSLAIFAFSFFVMVLSLIPWESFGITWFTNTSFLTGENLGNWYFRELQGWFLLMSILIGWISGMGEEGTVKAFVDGAKDMVGVALVIAVSRGISVLMSQTGLGNYILKVASGALAHVSPVLFTAGSYLIYLGLSVLIPSSSGLAAASMPTFGGLAVNLGLSAEVMILIFCAACGLINLITPTSAVVMGGLSISRVDWITWVKYVWKFLLLILVVNLLILSIAMVLL